MNPQDNNYGYLLIDTDEKKKKFGPKLNIDEYKDGGSQWNSVADGDVFHDLVIYRRPLVLPDDTEWRLVGLDETIEKGDKIFDSESSNWRNWLGDENVTVKSVLVWHPSALAFRRPKSKPQGERVIAVDFNTSSQPANLSNLRLLEDVLWEIQQHFDRKDIKGVMDFSITVRCDKSVSKLEWNQKGAA